MKSDALPTHYTRTGLAFSDGTEIPADVVVFCTGFIGNMRTDVARIFGDEVASRADDFWGLDEEGELRGAFKRHGRKCLPLSISHLFTHRPSPITLDAPDSLCQKCVLFSLLRSGSAWSRSFGSFFLCDASDLTTLRRYYRTRPILRRRHDRARPILAAVCSVADQGGHHGDTAADIQW